MTRAAAISFVSGAALAAAAPVVTLPMHKHTIDSGPRSALFTQLTNGSSIPAGGAVWPTAIYWTTVQVGTPAVDFPVAIDSGSGDLDISGAGCAGCPTAAPNAAYDHASSSTAHAAFPYKFSNSYQTCDVTHPTAVCSISGGLYKDQVSLAGLGPVEVTLGSIAKQDANFDQFKEIGGVMGFTMGQKKNVFASLVAAGKCENVWAMCMKEGTVSNGTITIGGVDARLSSNVSYVPDVGNGFHSVQVAAINLDPSAGGGGGGGSASISVGEAAILDTGTNILLAPTKVMSGLETAMCADKSLQSCAELWANKCVDLTDAQLAAYPSMSLVLSTGVELRMGAHDYLLRGSPLASAASQYCIGIRDGGSAGGSGFIIGDTTMRNYYLVFDLAQKQIGWGPIDDSSACGSI